MTADTPLTLHNLQPEQQLVSALPKKWQQRFMLALKAMDSLVYDGNNMTWEQIAQDSAISAHHFHRMFKLVFNETPGQYINRQRLQWAVTLLVSEPEFTITDIAQEAGFSSSQALAKALKRTLGLSAKAIRHKQNDLMLFEALMRKLGQPVQENQCLEELMAAKIEFKVLYFPSRPLITRALATTSMVEQDRVWRKMKPKDNSCSMVTLMKMSMQESQIDITEFEVGYFSHKAGLSTRLGMTSETTLISDLESSTVLTQGLPSGNYLCGKVTVSNLTAYFAAWDALFIHLLNQDLTPDPDTKYIDIIESPDTFWAQTTDIIISIRLMD
ncbi:MAG: AraC family transcriptional regulator [Pseudoalteromonas nigrifaciens]|uniref:helix-turn-helix transcriptional regulator n=1 Tax=Pseudoalteromonas nigrifaciens TaxID=28109 RepID=UPI003F98D29A